MMIARGAFGHRLAKAANDNDALAGLAYAVAGFDDARGDPLFRARARRRSVPVIALRNSIGAETGTSEAHHGQSSLDCGAVVARHASGGAAFSGRAEAREARSDRLLALYEAGYSLAEVGAREGLSGAAVHAILNFHPDFAARRSSPGKGRAIPVPEWVPAEWHDAYRRLAAANDEETAASCMRKRKRLEARS